MHHAQSTIRRTAAIGLLATVLWVAQLAGEWKPPIRAGEIVPHNDVGLCQVVESEWGRYSRMPSPERPGDPSATSNAAAFSSPCNTRRTVTIAASAFLLFGRTCLLPGIRAPPQPVFSV